MRTIDTKSHPPAWSILGLALILAACSGGGPPGNAPPATPTGLVAAGGDGQVALTWNAVGDSDLARYNIYRGTASGSLAAVGSTGAGTESFTDTGLANGTTYLYAIAAEDQAGQTSGKSPEVSATPSAGGADKTAPVVTASEPEAGATGIALNDSFSISFSEPMDRASVESALTTSPGIDCSFRWNLGSTTLSCQPGSNLAAATSYRVSVGTGAKDAAGNALAAPFVFSFRTGTTSLQTCVFDDVAAQFGNCVFGP